MMLAACYVSTVDAHAPSPWNAPETVAGFAQSFPNAVLMRFAEDEIRRAGRARVLDLGCGAGRNAVPLARLGWDVVGIDLSIPMLSAAMQRAREEGVAARVHVVRGRMDAVPARDGSFDSRRTRACLSRSTTGHSREHLRAERRR